MKETIYTIPVNDAFDKKCGCPICTLYAELEKNEIDRIIGPAMMEPDVRDMTNEQGFCRRHLELMRAKNAVLPLALMLETHAAHLLKYSVKTLDGRTKPKGIKAYAEEYRKRNSACCVCHRIERFFEDEVDTVFRLYKSDEGFREKIGEQPMYCMPHARLLLSVAAEKLSAPEAAAFAAALTGVTEKYLSELKSDLGWFCKKFDYRYDKEDWKNSRDSVERAIDFLRGKG